MQQPVQHLGLQAHDRRKGRRAMGILREIEEGGLFGDLQHIVAAELHVEVRPARFPVDIPGLGLSQILQNIGGGAAGRRESGAGHDRLLTRSIRM